MKVFLIRLLAKFLAALPLPAVQALGSLLGRAAWFFDTRSAKVTRRNLELCRPDLDTQARERLGKLSMIETGKSVMETGKAWMLPTAGVLKHIKAVHEGVDFNSMTTAGKGIVAIVPHLGNWEFLNIYAASRFPLNILYQPPRQQAFETFITESRARTGTNVFPTNRRGVAAMFQALNRGEVVGILPDQEVPREAGVFSPFFGISALTMTLISKLVQKTGATVVCGFAKRLPRGEGFEVFFTQPDADIYSADLSTSVAALNRSVEACVAQAPAQYQWEYKRFRANPEGGRTSYYNF